VAGKLALNVTAQNITKMKEVAAEASIAGARLSNVAAKAMAVASDLSVSASAQTPAAARSIFQF
jgi:hypothetical protein